MRQAVLGVIRSGSDPLTWDDARAAVFHTALLMYEYDRLVDGSNGVRTGPRLRPDPDVTALAIANGAALLRDTVVVGITPVERAATCVVVELV